MKPKNKNVKTSRIKPFLFIVGVLACLALGFFGYVMLTGKASPTLRPTTATVDPAHPDVAKEGSDETPVVVNSLDDYKVAADAPRILKIDSLGIDARVRSMGVNSLGAIQAPVNIYDSGWYTGSAKPGDSGAAFIDGHASGATRQGLFAYIDTLQKGNMVTIERGDGQVLGYKVVNVETVSKDTVDMQKALRVYGDAKEGLNLMTCTGTWINDENTYDKRVIVYTERVS